MTIQKTKTAAAALALAVVATPVARLSAQDSGALVDALARREILTAQEAEEIRAELAKEAHASIISTLAKGKATNALTFSGRFQVQYAALDTEAADAPADPSTVHHFFLRRIYFGADAKLGADWSASLNYDFAGNSFDKAFVAWGKKFGDQELDLNVGLRKVNFGFEEYTSSGSLAAIERSAATRFFAEDNNGRRLGAASYRIGLFLDGNKSAASGKTDGFFYGAAVTNPERVSSVSDVGNVTTNTVALWGNIGYGKKFSGVAATFGAAVGYLPGQGGASSTDAAAEGIDTLVGSVYGALKAGAFTLQAEALLSNISNIPGAADISPWGFWVQPSFKINENIELVARYSYVDGDGRGVRVSDGVRSAASAGGAGTGDALHEYFIGANYYFLGNDVKFQLGYVGGRTTGAARNETVNGVRSQLQVNF
jgi:phosphate-selective porin